MVTAVVLLLLPNASKSHILQYQGLILYQTDSDVTCSRSCDHTPNQADSDV